MIGWKRKVSLTDLSGRLPVGVMDLVEGSHTTDTLEATIASLMRRYYTAYYRDALGLPDWAKRVAIRLNEEEVFAEPVIQKIESWLNYRFCGKRVLVVGAATGAESLALARRGAQVQGIEPNQEALQVLRLKASARGLDPEAFVAAVAEQLPFPADAFDFVYCYTVLEHVRDVERSLDEMVRVCRPGGYVFIQTPEARFPYEGHYKLPLLPFAPRWVQAAYLRLRGRPSGFLRSVKFVTGPMLDRLCWNRPVVTIRVCESHLPWRRHRWGRMMARFCDVAGIPSQQVLFLKKMPLHAPPIESEPGGRM